MKLVAHDPRQQWAVLDAPEGGASSAAAAALLGVAEDALHAVFAAPEIRGLQLFAFSQEARDELAAALSGAAAGGDRPVAYRARVRRCLWADGELAAPFRGRPRATAFARGASDGAQCELALWNADADGAAALRFQLADAGHPVLGDTRYGGDAAAGPLRLRRSALRLPDRGIDCVAAEPAGWAAPAPEPEPKRRPVLAVSRATLRALAGGHPWILRDDETRCDEWLAPGTLVDVVGTRGKPAGTARIEGRGELAARAWSAPSEARPASIEARVAAALRRRRPLLARGDTDALRLVHGEADALPGLAVDRLGPLLRVVLLGRAAETCVERCVDALLYQLADALPGDAPVVRVVHLAPPPAGRLRCVEVLRGDPAALPMQEGRFAVREAGLAYLLQTGLEEPYRSRPGTGLFLDQRDNRARVRAAARGGRWLNLFCHTGAFSVAALAGGAREVTSVDLSAPYLAWLDANLAANGLADGRHRGVRGDVRHYLEGLDPDLRFDGIVLDPPTAAAAGRRFWSLRKEGGALLTACLARLRPGGMLLACRNDRGARGNLAELVRSAAAARGVSLAGVEPAPPGDDFPRLRGFPEGDAAEGVVATRTR